MYSRDKKHQVVPEVYKVFMTALIDVASHGKDLNSPATTVRQLQRCFYHDDRGRHDGKEKKRRESDNGCTALTSKAGRTEEVAVISSDYEDVRNIPLMLLMIVTS